MKPFCLFVCVCGWLCLRVRLGIVRFRGRSHRADTEAKAKKIKEKKRQASNEFFAFAPAFFLREWALTYRTLVLAFSHENTEAF